MGDFHLELRTRTFPQSTLFERDISYDTRYQILDRLPGGEELNLCLLVKSSSGRLRRWRQDQCRKIGPFSAAPPRILAKWLAMVLASAILAFLL